MAFPACGRRKLPIQSRGALLCTTRELQTYNAKSLWCKINDEILAEKMLEEVEVMIAGLF